MLLSSNDELSWHTESEVLMKFNINGRNKKVIAIATILSIIVGGFVGVRAYNTNVSQQAFIQIKQDAKVISDQEAKAKAEEDAKVKAEQDYKTKADQEAKTKADQEAKAKAKAEQDAKTKADQEAKTKADQVALASNTRSLSTSPAKTQVIESKGFKNPIFANSSQVFLVTADGTSSSYGTGSMYEKVNGQWKKLSEFAVRLGAKGMSYNRVQNSVKTPAGVLNILSAFGVADNPGSAYAYHKVTSNDYWDSNSGSPTYNRMISSNIGGDLEHLIDYQKTYKYALVTDWNYNQTPDKGAAIFIHVNGAGATGSCISLPEGNMVSLMKWMNPSKNPKVLVVPNSDLGNYFY